MLEWKIQFYFFPNVASTEDEYNQLQLIAWTKKLIKMLNF